MTTAAELVADVCAVGIALEVRIWSPDAAKLPSQLRAALQKNQLEVAKLLLGMDVAETVKDASLNRFAQEHDDLDERDAIRHEERYATPQTIPPAMMIDGLLAASRRA